MNIIVSLIIGRGGSSFKNKNIIDVSGYPLVLWSGGAAKRSKYIEKFYCSSDSEKILDICSKIDYDRIKRPSNLSTSTSQSCDVVRHAITHIEKKIKKSIDILVVQHANVGTITEHMIDKCIDILNKDLSASAVIPTHVKNEYHPARAKFIDSDGYLKQALDGTYSANRQDLEEVYFFDHSFWVIRGEIAKKKNGQPPWDCMGDKIIPFLTNGCFDVHNKEDIVRTEKWIQENNIPEPI